MSDFRINNNLNPPLAPNPGLDPGAEPVPVRPRSQSQPLVHPQGQLQNPDANMRRIMQGGDRLQGPQNQIDHALNFAPNHRVESGRDWDFNTDKGMFEVCSGAAAKIKDQVAGTAMFAALNQKLDAALRRINENPDLSAERKENLQGQINELKQLLRGVQQQRRELTAGIPAEFDKDHPAKAVAQIRKTLRVFRYETQKCLNDLGVQGIQTMHRGEKFARALQNFFTFKVAHHVQPEDFNIIGHNEELIQNRLAGLSACLLASNMGNISLPHDFKLTSTINETLKSCHQTNDQIRDYQDQMAANATTRDIISPVCTKGGKRTVEFRVGADILLGVGTGPENRAVIGAGMRVKLQGEISTVGPGYPIEVTYRWGGDIHARASAKFGINDDGKAGLNAEAEAGVGAQHFKTISYPTMEDFLLDAERHGLATSPSFGDAIIGKACALGRWIKRISAKPFKALGKRSDDVKLNNIEYVDTLKQRNIFNALDGAIARRRTPMIIGERKGFVFNANASASIKADIMTGILSAGAGLNAAYNREFKVSSLNFIPFSHTVATARDVPALMNLLRAPNGQGPLATLPPPEASLEQLFREVHQNAYQNADNWNRSDWAVFANQIRTLMIAVECRCREGQMTREDADRALARYTNLSVRVPEDIFREYLMIDGGAGATPKVRVSAGGNVSINALTKFTKPLGALSENVTGTIADPAINAVGSSLVAEGRRQIGLDTTFKYNYTYEKPVNPNKDPRPWENQTRHIHTITMTASLPVRAIFESIFKGKVNANKEEPGDDELVTKEAMDQAGKETGKAALKNVVHSSLTPLVLSTVSEGARRGVDKWFDNPQNAESFANFIEEHLDIPLSDMTRMAEWLAEHQATVAEAVVQLDAFNIGSKSLTKYEVSQKLTLTWTGGKLESINHSDETVKSVGGKAEGMVEAGPSAGFELYFGVTENLKRGFVLINASLISLMGSAEKMLIADTSMNGDASRQKLRGYLARNFKPVKELALRLTHDEACRQLYARARTAARGDLNLLASLEEGWNKVSALDENSAGHDIAEAMEQLIVPMMLSFRSRLPPA